MRKPKDMMSIPQGLWYGKFPDGYEVRSNHPSDFLRQCFQHLEVNGLDSGTGWQDRMWEMVCDSNPDLPCEDSEAPVRGLGPDDVRRFLTTMWETWKSGAEPVSVEVQNARIDRCMQCPLKGYTACFGGCSQMSTMLAEFTMGRELRSHPEIHKQSCTACACLLETKTMFPLEILKAVDEKMGATPAYWDDSKGKCWMLEE